MSGFGQTMADYYRSPVSVFRRATSARLHFGGLGNARDLCRANGGFWDGDSGKCRPSSSGYMTTSSGAASACLTAGGDWDKSVNRCVFSDTVTVTGPAAPQIVKTPESDEGPGVVSEVLDSLKFWKPAKSGVVPFQWGPAKDSTPWLVAGLVGLALVGGYLLWRNS